MAGSGEDQIVPRRESQVIFQMRQERPEMTLEEARAGLKPREFIGQIKDLGQAIASADLGGTAKAAAKTLIQHPLKALYVSLKDLVTKRQTMIFDIVHVITTVLFAVGAVAAMVWWGKINDMVATLSLPEWLAITVIALTVAGLASYTACAGYDRLYQQPVKKQNIIRTTPNQIEAMRSVGYDQPNNVVGAAASLTGDLRESASALMLKFFTFTHLQVIAAKDGSRLSEGIHPFLGVLRGYHHLVRRYKMLLEKLATAKKIIASERTYIPHEEGDDSEVQLSADIALVEGQPSLTLEEYLMLSKPNRELLTVGFHMTNTRTNPAARGYTLSLFDEENTERNGKPNISRMYVRASQELAETDRLISACEAMNPPPRTTV